MKKYRAWSKLDNPRLKFISKEVDCELYFVMKNDERIRYPFSAVYLDEDWIIEESTGLFDKNGIEIFEGDYVEITTTNWWQPDKKEKTIYRKASVSFNKTTKEIQFLEKGGKWDIRYHELFRGGHDDRYYLRVVGNIHRGGLNEKI